MKKLIIINGTMGIGKSTVCKRLNSILEPSVFLDGDWCWNMNPFVVTQENKKMVMNNITYLLNSFLQNEAFEYVVFCWVMHTEAIIEEILSALSMNAFELHKFTLTMSENLLRERLKIDVQNGNRTEDIIEKSLDRLAFYEKMNTVKVQNIDLEEAVATILNHIRGADSSSLSG